MWTAEWLFTELGRERNRAVRQGVAGASIRFYPCHSPLSPFVQHENDAHEKRNRKEKKNEHKQSRNQFLNKVDLENEQGP